jgi:Asp-tRNA(Asn)/Glu-tRNA(Gln) amidotransferase C subunit
VAVSTGEVTRLAELSGLRFPDEDLEHLATALADHGRLVASMLDAETSTCDSALTFDPRWRA